MKASARVPLFVVVLLGVALLAACRPVSAELAQSGGSGATEAAATGAATSTATEVTFGANTFQITCDTDGVCSDGSNEYTCDASGICTDQDGYQYQCDAQLNCGDFSGVEAATEPPTLESTEEPTEAVTEAPIEVATEQPTEVAAEAPTEAPTTAVEPTGSASGGGNGMTATQIDEMVREHNRWRAEVGVPGLKWSNSLAAGAQEWANHLAEQGGGLVHSSGNYGENLFGGGGKAWGPTDAVNSWGGEKQFYNGDPISNSNFMKVGHYTQMVWRGTTEVGCGVATAANGSTVWVCRYSPPGNMIGERPF